MEITDEKHLEILRKLFTLKDELRINMYDKKFQSEYEERKKNIEVELRNYEKYFVSEKDRELIELRHKVEILEREIYRVKNPVFTPLEEYKEKLRKMGLSY